MSTKEWLADIGAAAEELGYGVVSVGYDSIELVAAQENVTVRVESRFLSGDFLRGHLVKIEHRSSSPWTTEYERIAPR